MTPSEVLTTRRKAVNISIQELSHRTGISIPILNDLEKNIDDIHMAISLRDLAKICYAIQVTPQLLFGGQGKSGTHLRFKEIAAIVQRFVNARHMTILEFGDEIGWNLEGFLEHPEIAWNWNVDCLNDVTEKIGVRLLDALPTVSDITGE